ncbi:MAG: cyclic nucleotide-binding domain-containing protein [Methylococcaceae bacterium]|nr:cyclic nucleotide-binding domain-containing protein [Methylococcaceae bacterium]
MKDKFHFDHASWLSIFFGGVFIGFIQTFFTISIAALIFSGKLTAFLSSGISMMLIGYIVLSLLIAIYSSLIGSLCSIQETPAIVLMTIINGIILKNPTINNNELFVVATSAIVITTVVTGLFFYLLGRFKLGDLIRYMPYPVIAGFLAGTGWTIVQGGIELILGGHENLSLAILFHENYLSKWLLGLAFGFILFFMLKRYKNILILPAILVTTIGGFYLTLIIQDISIAEIKTQGWLLSSIPEVNDKNLAIFNIGTVNWLFVLKQVSSGIPALVLVSAIALLLNINAIEILTKKDMDLNKSLKVTGIANLFSGLCGATVGYAAVDMTSLSYRMNIMSRSLGLISALVTFLVLYFCLPALNFLPNFVIGGFLIYIGIDFLYDWIYSVWFKLNKTEYAIVVLVMLIIIFSGFMQGVAFGIVIALSLFAINFSNVSIIKNSLSGSELQSNTQRGADQQQLLIEQGKKTQVIMLTGFIFFGTANKLCVQLRERANSTVLPPLKYILLDWRQVTGMDSSTVYSLQKIQQLSMVNDIQLIFTNVPDNIKLVLNTTLVDSCLLSYFSELNHGLDWCENEILAEFQQNNNFFTFEKILVDSGVNATEIAVITSFFEKKDIPVDYYLIRQGDTAEKLYFIESGCLDVFFESETGKRLYLQRISTGLFVGEIGLILKQPRAASIITTKPSVVYEISSANLDLMKANAIEAYAEFERVMILLLARRLFIVDARVKRLL